LNHLSPGSYFVNVNGSQSKFIKLWFFIRTIKMGWLKFNQPIFIEGRNLKNDGFYSFINSTTFAEFSV
jgi:hypothetical protein